MFVAILVIWDKDSALTYHPWQIIDATIVTLTANKFMPIPGAELSTEKTLQLLLERGGGISGNNVDEKYVSNIVTNGILI
jgi:hypothetical protein